MKNAISWFEIPSTDLDRAQRFYETIFKVELFPLDLANIRMAPYCLVMGRILLNSLLAMPAFARLV